VSKKGPVKKGRGIKPVKNIDIKPVEGLKIEDLVSSIAGAFNVVRGDILKRFEKVSIKVGDRMVEMRRGLDIDEVDIELEVNIDPDNMTVSKSPEGAIRSRISLKLRKTEFTLEE